MATDIFSENQNESPIFFYVIFTIAISSPGAQFGFILTENNF